MPSRVIHEIEPCSNHVLIFVNMAGMEFVIPASKEELRRDEGKGVYVVRQTFDSDELTVVLEGM